MESSLKNLIPIIILALALMISGCGDQKQMPQKQINPTKVKVMKVLRTDAPLNYEYSGQVISKGEVKVQSKISGRVTEKFIRGGQEVYEGQMLYKIDSRQYEASILQAQATLAKSRTNLNNALNELARNQRLYDAGAVSEQTLTNQKATVDAQEADVAANEALLLKAQEDLKDTVVYAPMSGRTGIDDVAVGSYVNAGNTCLVTISSNDPIFVEYSISETEYLKFMNAAARERKTPSQRVRISLSLADGTTYPYEGEFGEADSGLTDNTGTLTLRTLFANPNNFLVPGMFAKITISGITIPNAILVPERAIQQLLGESFVLIANAENKSEIRTVKLGEKIGSYYIVTEGLKSDDMVIVEGLSKLRENMPLEVTEVTAKEMGFSMKSDDTLFNSDKRGSE
ncbi:MAG: efflux RND transporter periplasmic adaptor subunit [Selenomonadaceae bacterium]|nr:efflux RND transporter periplasmic adaptor subunit [Selenomonadaceae bacterium]